VRPLVFDGTVGWLHPAAGDRGVVIAGAHGFEDLCSRRFLTLAARGMAAAGLPVLQFDYPGCGDAAGSHAEPGRVAAWIAGIGGAIDRLKAETGVTSVLVVGFRLGAMLAPLAIAERRDVAGLALLAPPPTGKAYMREMAGLARMIDGALPPFAGADPFNGVEAAGFRVSAETAADLRGLDWRENMPPFAGDLLLVPQQVSQVHSELAGHVAAAGGAARVEPFAGYSRLMSSPTASDIPLPVLDAVVGWAAQRAKSSAAALAGSLPALLKGDGYAERPVVLGPAPEICGVLCMPAGALAAGEAALILNAGAIPHVGWARGAVDMARSLAREGVASLRVDLPGLGQSEAAAEARVFLYDERGRGDVLRIVDWLSRQGFGGVCAIGTCAGGFQAFHAARYDRRITALAMVNPLCFAWNGSYALDMELSKVRDNARRTPDPGDEPKARQSGVGWFGAASSRLARGALRSGLELLKSAMGGFRNRGSVERWMRDLAARGTRVLVVSAEGDRSIEEIARHFGPDGARLRDIEGVRLARLEAADHTLTPLHARERLFRQILGLLKPAAAQHAAPDRTARQRGREPRAAA
jgi:alpha/beta superfamily hydrolase